MPVFATTATKVPKHAALLLSNDMHGKWGWEANNMPRRWH